ncbi:glycosyltransferase family 4 protein [Flexibacterium corallicola]|uniref:glycosyltransferase family 4 protein n=1 Tax=Flexibacterium corallicola TaxID=3037259 RepID=UPI00286F81AB|nr:glycosyltransferase family 4 protein [Pseudovibrio sp. M1P-2-3]
MPTIMQIVPDLRTGGAERTTVDVAEAIVKHGWGSIVLSEGGRLLPELEATGARHIQFPAGTKSPARLWQNSRRIIKIARESNVSLIHARSRAPAWSALWAAHALKIPFVTTYHGLYKEQNALKAFYNSAMTRSDAIIANSNYTAGVIRQRNAAVTSKITVIHRGSDLGYLDPNNVEEERKEALRTAWGLRKGQRVILNVARLTAWKGQGVLIDAAVRLLGSGDYEDLCVVLAGDHQGREEYLRSLKSQIDQAGLSERIKLVGHCADVAAAHALADVSVVASIEPEAFGRAAVEAQAARVPVIVSDIGAVPETVLVPPVVSESERTGWHVPAGDAESLARTLETVLSLPQVDLEDLRSRALAHVKQKFTKEAMCSATLDVYAKQLGN